MQSLIRVIVGMGYVALVSGMLRADDTRDKQIAFFETKIRPVLIDACYECHSTAGKQEGNLTLDDRAGLLRGGDRGPAIVPGHAEKSLLIAAIRHADDDLRMPSGGAKLKPAVIADFATWINAGAIDPRDEPPTPNELAKTMSWEQIRERRRSWWSFQPLQVVEPPVINEPHWQTNAIDRFIRAKQIEEKVTSAAPADPATLLRRVTLLLTGVPPTPAEVKAYLADSSPAAYERAVDRLLASSRFGEAWARHWMDWFRLAESHGSEGDPTIPHAWRYRDYLIRAWNDDVPYNQLIREHIAGDLLPAPRLNQELGIRESALGIGHLRMVQHGFAPTDALDDRVRVIDNQIDVVSKSFLGLTVACARCHHHKFDPISQDDFYAWYGIFASCHPGTIIVDTPERLRKNESELADLKARLKSELAKAWLAATDNLPRDLLAAPHGDAAAFNKLDPKDKAKEASGWKASLNEAAASDGRHPLAAWQKLRTLEGAALADAWKKIVDQSQSDAANQAKVAKFAYPLRWKLSGQDYAKWFKHGNGLPPQASSPGEFHVLADGDRVVANVYPAGAYTHTLSNKQAGVLTSPRFKIECNEILVRVAGGSNARVRYVVQNYPRVVLIYPHSQLESETAKWFKWDARYWKGEHAHIEIVTGDDQPLDIGSNQGRSWFGALEVIGKNQDQPMPVDMSLSLLALLTEEERNQPPHSAAELANLYATVLKRSIQAWQAGNMTDLQAEWLGFFVRRQLLPTGIEQLPQAAPLLADYRRLEKEVIVPTRAAGVHEGEPFDQPLYERGNHLKPTTPVARRFLEVFNPQPYATSQSGRLELAESLSDAKNPLVSRVIVNRIWQHIFGRGIVGTPDNFGRLGEEPTHPELHDYLAAQFSGQAKATADNIQPWSLKSLIRAFVLTETFKQASTAASEAKEKDADNRLLTRFQLRRLEAEAIRDSLVAVAVGLDETMYGPSAANNSNRRGVYMPVRRNSLDPFLTTFDCPEPVSTVGRRDTTNVPAQSLTLLNDGFVINLAQSWANRVLADSSLKTEEDRVRSLLFAAVGREPTAAEIKASLRYLHRADEQRIAALRDIEQLQSRSDALRRELEQRLEPLRAKLRAARKTNQATPAKLPQPVARWEFDGNLRDSIGQLHGEIVSLGNEQRDQVTLVKEFVRDGSLVLDGRHYVKTPVLTQDVAAKTFEAWVQLDSFDQRGGAAISLETPGGAEFDALVFGEQEPRRWMSGSEFFRRTKSFGGAAENEAVEQPVHVAVVYSADGKITLYRQGRPLGEAYGSAGPHPFAAGKSQLLFGLRHSPAAPGKLLSGKIHRAQWYDRALSAEEIAATSGSVQDFISRDDLLAALPEQERLKMIEQEKELAKLALEMQSLSQADDTQPDVARSWRDLCQSLFNWKEFLYVH